MFSFKHRVYCSYECKCCIDIRNCKECGKKFSYLQTNRTVYCSDKCIINSKKNKNYCKNCGKLITKKFRVRYCDDKCFKQYYHPIKKIRCRYCNGVFINSYKHRLYCSDECYRKNQIEYKQNYQKNNYERSKFKTKEYKHYKSRKRKLLLMKGGQK